MVTYSQKLQVLSLLYCKNTKPVKSNRNVMHLSDPLYEKSTNLKETSASVYQLQPHYAVMPLF